MATVEELKCFKCNGFLSCGPVFIVHSTGQAICGRCSNDDTDSPDSRSEENSPESSDVDTIAGDVVAEELTVPLPVAALRTRMRQYEVAASLIRFPCQYVQFGCRQELQFQRDSVQLHELTCLYRPRPCPMMLNKKCPWMGITFQLEEHCVQRHPELIVKNVGIIPHDLTKQYCKNFLVLAFNFLFLLNIKVCPVNGKIYHLLRYLGDNRRADYFKYMINVDRNGMKFLQTGIVEPKGELIMDESKALVTNFPNLLETLGGLDNLKFIIILQEVNRVNNCKYCGKEIGLSNGGVGLCNDCNAKLHFCQHRCSFTDVTLAKCEKHEEFYCKVTPIRCPAPFCSCIYYPLKTFDHFTTAHQDTCSIRLNTIWTLVPNYELTQLKIIPSQYGNIICKYKCSHMYRTELEILIYTPMASDQLRKYFCTVTLLNPFNEVREKFSPNTLYDHRYDWRVIVTREHFPKLWSKQYECIIAINSILP